MSRIAIAALLSVVLLVPASSVMAQGRADRDRMPAGVAREVNWDAVPLEDAVEFLRDATTLNISVNWKAIELAGIDRATPVTLHLRDVPVRKLIDFMLIEAGPGALDWYLADGIVRITTQAEADKQMVTRVYPVEELLVTVPDFEGPKLNLERSGGGEGGGSSGGIVQGNSNGQDEAKTRVERADDLVAMITSTVRPDVWRDNGGTASIRFYDGKLIVTAPRSVHGKLGF